jgi:hypothetical protein
MTSNRSVLSVTLLAALLCSCATTSIKSTWKSPDYPGGPLKNVAVLAVTDSGMIRQGFENRFVNQLGQRSQAAISTFNVLSLPEIKENKAAAGERLLRDGADSILILRLLDRAGWHELRRFQLV